MRPVTAASLFATLASLLAASFAAADVNHVIGRGHTVEAIAHRYHVSVKSILDANKLKDAKHLKVGDTLVIPGVTEKSKSGATGPGKGKKGEPARPVTYAMRAKTPGVIHATRLATNESFTLRVSTRRGKQSPTAAKQAEQLLRSAGGLSHPIEPRILALLGVVSNHFGSRKIEVISGFRPYTPTQHTAHSNHNIGRAIDFRVVGVPNEVVRDFCRTLKNVGCGYYPNSTFVHMDARDSAAFWIDYSRPGETPRYNAANVDADEGTSDVGEEAHVAPPEPPSPEALPDPSATPAPATSAPAAAPSAAPSPSAPAPSASGAASATPEVPIAPAPRLKWPGAGAPAEAP